MLFVIYGGTLELGFRSREFFKKRGFDIIKKYNYVTETSTINRKEYESPSGVYEDWFNDKIYVDKTEIEKLDFRYENPGIILGFDKRQIVSSVHGFQNSARATTQKNNHIIMAKKALFSNKCINYR